MQSYEWRTLVQPKTDRFLISKERSLLEQKPLHFYVWPLGWTQQQCMDHIEPFYEVAGFPWNVTVRELSEKITYENTQFKRYGDCVHDKDAFTTHGGANATWCPVQVTPSTPIHHFGNGPFGLIGGADELWFGYPSKAEHLPGLPPTEFDVESTLEQATLDVAPEILEEMSLLVTLAELAEMKRLITGPLSMARELVRNLKRGKNKAWTFAKLASNITLMHEYGTKQTVSDLISVYAGIMETMHRLEAFIDRSNTPQVRHWALPPVKRVETSYNTWYPDSNWAIRRFVHTQVVESFNVTIKYKYSIVDTDGDPLFDRDLLILGAHMDAFGLNWNPAILWDATPFTFVVDWFLGVGNWLETFKVNNLNTSVTILDACYSIKRESSTHSSGRNAYRNVYAEPADQTCPYSGKGFSHRYTKHYERHRFVPRASWLHGSAIDLDTPSLKQWTIGAALVNSNIR